MDHSIVLSPAETILEAVQLTSDVDISALRQLITTYPEFLKVNLVLRILLTFLPESTDPVRYTEFLEALCTGRLEKDIRYAGPAQSERTSHNTTSRVRRLHLLPLADPTYIDHTTADPLTLFLLHRARRIDDETGSLLLVSRLIEPFLGYSEHLRAWAIATLLPLLRLNYEYYPHNRLGYSLHSFEVANIKAAINALLSEAEKSNENKSNIGRDIRGLVGPWISGNKRRKRRKRRHTESDTSGAYLSTGSIRDENDTVSHSAGGWNDVYEWLLSLAVRDYPRAVSAVLQWNGPLDVDYGGWDDGEVRTGDAYTETSLYAQASLAMVYASSSWGPELLKPSYLVIQKVAKLLDVRDIPELNIEHANDLGDLSSGYLHSLSQSNFLTNSLLRNDNPLTVPSTDSLRFCHLLLLSNAILESSSYQISPKKLAELSLFGSEADQMTELRKITHMILQKPKDQEQWVQIRKQMLWLQDWGMPSGGSEQRSHGIFGRVDAVTLEIEMLKLLLKASRTSWDSVRRL